MGAEKEYSYPHRDRPTTTAMDHPVRRSEGAHTCRLPDSQIWKAMCLPLSKISPNPFIPKRLDSPHRLVGNAMCLLLYTLRAHDAVCLTSLNTTWSGNIASRLCFVLLSPCGVRNPMCPPDGFSQPLRDLHNNSRSLNHKLTTSSTSYRIRTE